MEKVCSRCTGPPVPVGLTGLHFGTSVVYFPVRLPSPRLPVCASTAAFCVGGDKKVCCSQTTVAGTCQAGGTTGDTCCPQREAASPVCGCIVWPLHLVRCRHFLNPVLVEMSFLLSHSPIAAALCQLADDIFWCCPSTMPCKKLEGSEYSKCCDPKNSECGGDEGGWRCEATSSALLPLAVH